MGVTPSLESRMTKDDIYFYDHYLWIVPYIVVIYFTIRMLLAITDGLKEFTKLLEKYDDARKMADKEIRRIKK
jgi:hypothetical protein